MLGRTGGLQREKRSKLASIYFMPSTAVSILHAFFFFNLIMTSILWSKYRYSCFTNEKLRPREAKILPLGYMTEPCLTLKPTFFPLHRAKRELERSFSSSFLIYHSPQGRPETRCWFNATTTKSLLWHTTLLKNTERENLEIMGHKTNTALE